MALPPRLLAWVKAALAAHAIVMAFSIPTIAWIVHLNLGKPDDKMSGAWILGALAFLMFGTVMITLYILIAYGGLGLVRRMILRRVNGDDTADGVVLIGAIAACPALSLMLADQPLLMLAVAVTVVGAFLAIWRITRQTGPSTAA